jgi:UDP-4-amino-4,6-dideoxy-N-acetyl-beta-L-altrosamine transaminase
MTGVEYIPYGRQLIDDDDVAAVAAVLNGDWLTTGPAVEEFEYTLAAHVGARHAIVCSSGTAALHLAAMAAGLNNGDSAIVPTITFLATANCVRYVGAEVVFADVDAQTGLLGESHLDEALSRHASAGHKVRAVLPVHLNGHVCEMMSLSHAAARHGLTVIEDASHAIGSTYTVDGVEHRVGACVHSDMCIFSFHPVKTVTMGEGGAITTNDDALAQRLRDLRNHGMTRDAGRFANQELAFDESGNPNPWYYEQHMLGFNYRATDIQCALGTRQLGKLPRFAEIRRRLAAHYDQRLKDSGNFVAPVPRMADTDPVLHLYAVHINFSAAGMSRARLMERLSNKGIGTQVHYIPVHRQPYYVEQYGETELPGANRYYAGILSLPLHAGMTESDVDRVVDTLTSELGAQ